MNPKGFEFKHSSDHQTFVFTDSGKEGKFQTGIVYSPLEDNPNTYNLALVAKNPTTGEWDDKFYTKNGNAIKVFKTVAATMELFYEIHPKAKVSFTGSDNDRTEIYAKIIKARYSTISEFYTIEATYIDNDLVIVPYIPSDAHKYKRFILERKSN